MAPATRTSMRVLAFAFGIGSMAIAIATSSAPSDSASPILASRLEKDVLLLRDDRECFEVFEREFRRAWPGRVLETVTVSPKTRALPAAISKLTEHDGIVCVGRASVRFLTQRLAEPPSCRVSYVAAPDASKSWAPDDALSIHVPPAARLTELLRAIPDIGKIGVLVPADSDPSTRATVHALRAVEAAARRDVLEVQTVSNAGAAIEAISRFSSRVEVLLLLPDRRVLPPAGSRLELEFLRALVRHGIWVASHDPETMPSRTIQCVRPDFVALARSLVRALQLPRGPKGGLIESPPGVVRTVTANLEKLRSSRRR
ncbi:MAG: hypothetical protein H6832_08905 [Planctomycetes bacterium]|nr:hypothetical protein [Planctomycetota bacterium]